MIGLVGDSLGTISMEPTEEESGEQHPSLPPNYVSLAQLQERWLQRQKQEQKQEIEEQEEKREPIILNGESRSQQEKGKNKFWGKKKGRERNGRRSVEGGPKVFMPKGVLEGNSPEIGVAEREELKVGAHRGVDGAGGVEENTVSWKKNKNNWKKRAARVNGSLIGELENRGNLAGFSRKNGGEEACGEEFGRNNRDREVDGKVNVCMVSVVPGTKGKEVTLVGVGGGDKGFGEENSRSSDDRSVGESSTMGLTKGLPEIGSEKEGSAAANEDYRGMLETGSVSVAEVSLKNEVEKDCSVDVGRKRGEGRFRTRYKRNVNNRRCIDSTGSKVELGCKENAVEKGVLGKEECRDHKGTIARGIEAYGDTEMVIFVRGNKGKEVTLVGVGGGDKGFGEENSRSSDDRSVGESSTMGLTKGLPEIGSEKEGSAAANEDYRGMLETGSVSVAEVSLKNEVEKDCSVDVGRKRGEGRFRTRYKRNVNNSRRCIDSTGSKVELGCKENAVEKGVLGKEECRDHKGTIARGIEAYGDTEMVSDNLLPKLRRDLRSLSLDESRVGNAAMRRGRHVWQQRRNEKSRDVNNLVWMKKGEISNTNVPEI